MELAPQDAAELGIAAGDQVDVITARGSLRGEMRFGTCRPGVVFVPFHYGYWDTGHPAEPASPAEGTAANETTVTDWDPVSKQPLFKLSAARLEKVTG